ncbi:protein shisa-5-like isoform X2 [Megalobrama amblycephala]|uniref:protein shisa-5-like isoform X2 n=1 Tax=Megalobrama amblycephala TaxID=75352 RepID=UPI00201450EB|nr:protein shisa-5-like isoform X2 [Megalobrama amblycephala]
MPSSVPILFMFVCLFTTVVGRDEDCNSYGGSYELCKSWEFCCGICGQSYCCSDPQKRLNGRLDCLLKGMKELGEPPRRETVNVELIGPILVILFVTSIIVLITCWVCPSCFLHKRFRSPRPVIATTTVVTTQFLPQPDVQGGRYLPYQPLPNNPPYEGQPMPIGAFKGQPYQEAGPAYPVPFSQAPNDGGQAMFPIQPAQPLLPTDYTSPQPAYNPAYVDLQGISLATAVQSVKTDY